MLKKIINIGLVTTFLLGSLGSISYADKTPKSPNFQNNIAPTSVKPSNLSIVTEGFEKLCSGHTKDAYTFWLSHTIPVLRDITTPLTQSFASTQETMFGKCTRYTRIGSVSVTEKTQIVYFVSEHEKAPLFWQFVVYQTPQAWEISSFNFNTNPNEVIPPSLFNNSKHTLVIYKT